METPINLEENAKEVKRGTLQEETYKEILEWIRFAYRNELAGVLNRKRIALRKNESVYQFDRVLAGLSRDLTFALHVCSHHPRAYGEFGNKLERSIFGDDEGSVANCLGKANRSAVEAQLYGPISVLTFHDLIDNVVPDLSERLDITVATTVPKEDVKHKVDAKLDFGTRRGGRPVLRLVQLKSNSAGLVEIFNINEPREIRGLMTKEETKIMLARADDYKRQGYNASCFAVTVPQYDHSAIRNVYGRIAQPEGSGRRLIQDFKFLAEETGLLPIIK
jgi:hypothetical protein